MQLVMTSFETAEVQALPTIIGFLLQQSTAGCVAEVMKPDILSLFSLRQLPRAAQCQVHAPLPCTQVVLCWQVVTSLRTTLHFANGGSDPRIAGKVLQAQRALLRRTACYAQPLLCKPRPLTV